MLPFIGHAARTKTPGPTAKSIPLSVYTTVLNHRPSGQLLRSHSTVRSHAARRARLHWQAKVLCALCLRQHSASEACVTSQAVAIDGRHSKYTLLIMTYESRLRMARLAVRHYSRCRSVGEVVIVWNAGKVRRRVGARRTHYCALIHLHMNCLQKCVTYQYCVWSIQWASSGTRLWLGLQLCCAPCPMVRGCSVQSKICPFL